MKNKDELIADILREEYIAALKKRIICEIDILTLEKMPGSTVVATKQITPQSSRDITATEMLIETRNNLPAYDKTLVSIDELVIRYSNDRVLEKITKRNEHVQKKK